MTAKFLSHKETLIELLNASEEFSKVSNLEEFLIQIGKIIPEQLDSQFQNFLTSTIICTDKNTIVNFSRLRPDPSSNHRYVYQLIDDVNKELQKNSNFVQCQGFQSTSLNYTNKYLISNEFETLLDLVGEEIMKLLLTRFLVYL